MKFNLVNNSYQKYQVSDTAWFVLSEFDYERHERSYYLGSDNYGLIWFMYGVGFVDSDMDAEGFPSIEYIKQFIANILLDYPEIDIDGR